MPVGDCLQSRLLQDCFCGCTSEHSRHYPCCHELGTFQLVSVGFRDSGTPFRRCILQQASLDRSVDETRCPRDQPKSAPASRIWRLFLGASLLMMLSCLSQVPPKNSSICSGGNCLIAYLYVLVSPRLCRISAKKACLSFLIVQLQHPSSTPLISSACNACLFLVYIYVLHTNLTEYATFNHSDHCLWINLVHSMHLTEFTTNPTTTDCTRVFPKVTLQNLIL